MKLQIPNKVLEILAFNLLMIPDFLYARLIFFYVHSILIHRILQKSNMVKQQGLFHS